MSQKFSPLRLKSLDEPYALAHPKLSVKALSEESPALAVMTDFEQINPITVKEGVAVDTALELMKSQHVRLLFVLDEQQQVKGIITAADIMGSKRMITAQQLNVHPSQIEVRHLMLNLKQIAALGMNQVASAKIGDIMLTLQAAGMKHMLVMDTDSSGSGRLRGIISASDISRQLKISFDVMGEAKSFAEIEQIVSPVEVANR